MLLSYSFILTALLSLSLNPGPGKDFLGMEGERLAHHPQKGVTIYELRADDGLTKWYGQHVVTEVCMSKQCKKIRIWLFWNGLGDYLGFQLSRNEQLTKLDHEPFTQGDYEQLHRILRDEESYTDYPELSDLVVDKDSLALVDGYSGATLPHLSSRSVDGAVYTCFTLWQIVHGPMSELIRGLFSLRVDQSYLAKLFATKDPALLEEAIDILAAFPSFQTEFVSEVISVIKSEDQEVALKALRNMEPGLLANHNFQQQLVAGIEAISPLMRAEIVWKLSKEKEVDVEVVSELLELFLKGKIEVSELRLVFEMIDGEMVGDAKVLEHLTALERHENGYVRRSAEGVLSRGR